MSLAHPNICVALFSVIFKQNQRTVVFCKFIVDVSFSQTEFAYFLHLQKHLIFVMQSIVKQYKCVQNLNESDGVVVSSSEYILHEIASIADFGLETPIQHKQADRFLQRKSFANF